MPKRLLCLMLMGLLSSCVTRYVREKAPSCQVPPPPPKPEIQVRVCGDAVCLSKEDTIALARYLTLVDEVEWALAGCPSVVR